jgi:hypothetical protein
MTTALVIANTVVTLLMALLMVGLLRSHAEVLRGQHARSGTVDLGRRVDSAIPEPIEGLPRARAIVGTTVNGRAMQLSVVGHNRPDTLLAFLSSGCLTCKSIWETLHESRLDVIGNARVVVITKDEAEESISEVRDLAPTNLIVIMSSCAWRDYNVPGSPYFTYVNSETGRIYGEGTGTSWGQVQKLLYRSLEDAGLTPTEAGVRSLDRRRRAREREERVDRELEAAGIYPGHHSLYPTASVSGELIHQPPMEE